MVLADRLSRFPSPCDNLPIELHQNIHALNFNSDRLHIVKGAIERDPTHSAVYRMTLNGWTNRTQDVPYLACHFWSLRDELTIKAGVLLKVIESVLHLNYMTEPSMTYMTATRT